MRFDLYGINGGDEKYCPPKWERCDECTIFAACPRNSSCIDNDAMLDTADYFVTASKLATLSGELSCEKAASLGWCLDISVGEWMRTNCPKSCEVCPWTDRVWDFEDGTLMGFAHEGGDCSLGVEIQNTPLQVYKSDQNIDNESNEDVGGEYFIDTYKDHDGLTCAYSDRIHVFTITEGTEISWRYRGCGHSMALMSYHSGDELVAYESCHQPEDMTDANWHASDLQHLVGENVYFDIYLCLG